MSTEDTQSRERAQAFTQSIVGRLGRIADAIGGEEGGLLHQTLSDAASVAHLINQPDVSLLDKIDALERSIDDPATLKKLLRALIESEEGMFGKE